MIDHHYCTGIPIRYTYIKVPVLTYLLIVITKRKEGFSFIIVLNTLYVCEISVTYNFCSVANIIVHENEKVTFGCATDAVGFPTK